MRHLPCKKGMYFFFFREMLCTFVHQLQLISGLKMTVVSVPTSWINSGIIWNPIPYYSLSLIYDKKRYRKKVVKAG